MTSARICQNCGHSLTPNDRFCPQCGTGQIPSPVQVPPAAGPWDGILDRLARAVAPRYRVIRLIGHGGMAGVYLAEEPRLGRRVALKVMAPGLMADPALVTRFEQEARTTAQLNHPNIVTIFDVDRRDDLHFFVMAYVAGRTLGQITLQETEPLPIRAVLHWFSQAGSGLAYAHRVGIVHRDIKPANIMVDGFGNALVTDFGIAKVADEPSLTRTGFLVGTPTYMSPEQCGGMPVTGAADQYSLGIVLYELLTGKPPFSGPTVSVLQAHVTQTARPVRELRPDCPPALAAAVDRMLLKSPAERFPTVAAAVSAAGATILGDDDPLRDRLGTLSAVADALELPPVGTLTPGEATTLPARVVDAQGRPLPGRQIRWASDTPAVLSVSEEGVVHALAPGTARVTAWCDGVAATTSLEITPAPGPLTRLADEGVGNAPVGATALFEPTPVPSTPVLKQPQEPTPSPEPVTPPPAPTPIPEPAAAATEPAPVDVADASPAPPAETAPLDAAGASPSLPAEQPAPSAASAVEPTPAPPAEPRAAVPLASPSPVVGRSQPAPPSRKNSRVPLFAGLGVLAIALIAAASLIDFGGAATDDVPPTQPSAASPPGDAGGTAQTSPPAPLTADSADRNTEDAGSDPTVAGTTEDRAEARPQPTSAAPAAPPPAAPERPATGTLRIAGTLPAGARVTLRGPGAEEGMVWTEGISLPPGGYTVQVTAPGYQAYRAQVTIRAGATATLSPELRADEPAAPIQPPPAQPPPAAASSDAAAEEAVRGVIAAFVKSLESRDLGAIARQYPASASIWSDAWKMLIEDQRNARNLETRLAAATADLNGDVAQAVFTLELRFDDFRNRSNQARSEFQATLRRSAGGWTITDLRQVQQ